MSDGAGARMVSTCNNTVKDSETAVDCSGDCSLCPDGSACIVDGDGTSTVNSDCTTNACDISSASCVADQCFDNHKDGTETDADCGWATCTHCVAGTLCTVAGDCQSPLNCPAGMCI